LNPNGRPAEVEPDVQNGIWDQLKTARGRGAPIPVLTPDAASRPAASDRSAYGLATSVFTQLWAWSSNLCIEPLQKLLYQIWAKVKKCKYMQISLKNYANL